MNQICFRRVTKNISIARVENPQWKDPLSRKSAVCLIEVNLLIGLSTITGALQLRLP